MYRYYLFIHNSVNFLKGLKIEQLSDNFYFRANILSESSQNLSAEEVHGVCPPFPAKGVLLE